MGNSRGYDWIGQGRGMKKRFHKMADKGRVTNGPNIT